jgi:hypothetical protein
MMKFDRELSRRVAHAAGAEWQNAWHKAWTVLQLESDLKDGLYVEGWAVPFEDLLIFEHSWVELDGRIIDPTRWDSDLAYFPALRFDKVQALEAVMSHRQLPIALCDGARLWDNPAYHRAWQDANAFIQSRLAEQIGRPH